MTTRSNDVEDIGNNEAKKYFWSKWCQYGCRAWCLKYFWEGQIQRGSTEKVSRLEHVTAGLKNGVKLTQAKRKLLVPLIPALVFHFFWWSFMIKRNLWYMFVNNYPMTITMFFASAIAAMTSKGGGAIAFPVLTLVMNVTPDVARDFAILIQIFGMGSASFCIHYMKVHIEVFGLICCFSGGVLGLIVGIEIIDQYLSASVKKMGFVSIWFAFTFALFLLNRQKKRRVFDNIPQFNWWRIVVIVFSGIIGGIITALCGSGIDMCCYGLLTLLFRVSEKVAAPTAVVLMASLSVVASIWRGLVLFQISSEAWGFLVVCIPVAVIGGPLGSLLGSHFHRLVLAGIVHIIDLAALIIAFIIVPQNAILTGCSCAVIVGGSVLFFIITKLGDYLLKQVVTNQLESSVQAELKDKTNPHLQNGVTVIVDKDLPVNGLTSLTPLENNSNGQNTLDNKIN